jgi:hypothetical protein
MKRLRDIDGHDVGDDRLLRRGVELLRGTPPARPAPDVELRVWRSIQGEPAPASRTVRGLMLKLAIAGVVALGAGTAGAVITRRWIAPRAPDAVAAPASAAAQRRAQKAIAAAPVDLGAEPPAAVAVADGKDNRPAAKAPARNAAKRPAAAAAPNAAAVARERTEVLDALVALRRERDPVRAGALLARYLSAHPRGTLREEALVLAIEAADARGDRAAGEQLARAYQDEFPAGRFLSFARSHTGRTTP